MDRFYERTTSMLRRAFDARISGPPVLPTPELFVNGERFVAAFDGIRAEAFAVARTIEKVPRFHELMPEQADVSANDARDWRMFIMKAYGIPVPANLDCCPVMKRLLAVTHEVLSAAFSFLAPRKHIPPHRGPFRGIMRFHLILKMPLDRDGRPAAALTIDGTPHRLPEGSHLLWDDTYEHEVLNDSDEVRIALLLDVRRPNMPLDMRILSGGVVTFVKAAMKLRGVSYGG